MWHIVTASSDTYITNKIIGGKLRATDANVGRAGTIDIFKLYDESTLQNTTGTYTEISRGLIKFDLSDLRARAGDQFSLDDASLQIALEMYNASLGNTVPEEFTLVLAPLSMSFSEGRGRDVASFGDLDVANYITASYSSGSPVEWYEQGAGATGSLGAPDIDVVTEGDLSDGLGYRSLTKERFFQTGIENLKLNLTDIVSATLANQLPDHGFRLSFTGSEETDEQTRFVKRFGSRHVSNYFLAPKLFVSYDDSIIDQRNDFLFDVTGSLFITNTSRGSFSNLLSGSSATQVTGPDSLLIKLVTGSYEKYVTASQHSRYGLLETGVYSGTFALSSFDTTIVSGTTTLANHVSVSGSITFDEYWISLDHTVGYHTGTVKVTRASGQASNVWPKDIEISVTNVRQEYSTNERAKLRVFVRDLKAELFPVKIPLRLKSIYLEEVYYRIKDVATGKIVIPFMVNNNGTRCSVDSNGTYFEIEFAGLPVGRQLAFEFLVRSYGEERIISPHDARFVVK